MFYIDVANHRLVARLFDNRQKDASAKVVNLYEIRTLRIIKSTIINMCNLDNGIGRLTIVANGKAPSISQNDLLNQNHNNEPTFIIKV